ncbi:odorant receptor 227 [Nasonia vitripennis]|uniref:Odorant receptor n=1 Tax=Nasonia vitripennis TaxID=7425 RepID=A0A7M6W5W6_NASVI|nr:odorant receptor 227 [Nasonia vitripennis]
MPTGMDSLTTTFQSISSSHLMFLQLSLFLPLESKSFSQRLISNLLQLWNHLMVIVYNVSYAGYGIGMALRRDIEIDYICEQIVVETFSARYILLCFKRAQLRRLIESCKRLWGYLEVGEDIVVRQFERKGHFFRHFLILSSLMAVTSYVVTAHFLRLPPLEANGTERKMLPFRFFMDVQEGPAFNAMYALQIINSYYLVFMFASVETVSLYLIMMACGYLRSLQDRLLSLITEMNEDDLSKNGEATFNVVMGCAHFHQKIMIFCKDVDQMTRTLFLFACFCPIYNMSITGIKLLESDEDKFKYASLLFVNLFQFFSCQWAPEFLIIESEAIATAAYFASLQPFAPSHREKINRILYFMMMRAQKPIQLTAGGFIKLSIETFGAMVKSAFSFFAVLRSFRT